MKEAEDYDYLTSEIKVALDASSKGIERISKIVLAIKEFSHPGRADKTPTDLNQSLENTITVTSNEWKYVADIETDFATDMPLVPCLRGEINQVFLNLIVNATHTILDVQKQKDRNKGIIKITTKVNGVYGEIRISDTGTGISKDIQNKVFDPFFTTKDFGKGTGQGLSMAYAIVVKKHQGKIFFETEVNKGTTFIIQLPLKD